MQYTAKIVGSRRLLLLSVAIAAAMMLGGCGDDRTPALSSSRHTQPLSEKIVAEIDTKNMTAQSPILMRIFKEESELEIWKEDRSGRFALLRSYPICRWSGELGPKIKAGDRQAPEGFYTITPGLMNPNSNYYLAINTGFPNAYDRANERTGHFLMIHGDCSSAGCYAMTDEQIGEIYALAREAFFGGQKSFQVQAYPFRMTPLNMARHRGSPHMAFWRMLKEGNDHFEVTRMPPKVDVCEKRYVFNAEFSAEPSAVDRCPAHRVPPNIVAAVRDKQHRDEMQTAELINRGAPFAPITNRGQGGMNRTFLAAIAEAGPGVTIRTSSGTIPAHAHPPAVAAAEETPTDDDTASSSTPQLQAPPQVASAAPMSLDAIGTLLRNRSSKDATGVSRSDPQSAEPRSTNSIAAKRNVVPRAESTGPQTTPAETTTLIRGAAPALPSSGFDRRSVSSP
jgi:murein L,D-transpeptidase YafK